MPVLCKIQEPWEGKPAINPEAAFYSICYVPDGPVLEIRISRQYGGEATLDELRQVFSPESKFPCTVRDLLVSVSLGASGKRRDLFNQVLLLLQNTSVKEGTRPLGPVYSHLLTNPDYAKVREYFAGKDLLPDNDGLKKPEKAESAASGASNSPMQWIKQSSEGGRSL